MQISSLGNLPIDKFLSEYWQKKPLLIRNALENFESPIQADELAGLACEEQVESRIIFNQDNNWQLNHGPFEENYFSSLPASNWTLLVQAVDHWSSKAAHFLQQFKFIPSWRIDDLMVSYATQGGGVGPHFDQYDVFLVQSKGQRQWEVGDVCDESTELIKDAPVSIISHFQAKETWVLNPGDILYVPPGFAHNGTAVSDDCITCSVGFRAPSHSEILREFTDHIGESLSETLRYEDQNLEAQAHSGEISTQTINKIQNILKNYSEDKQLITEWFGKYASTPKYREAHEPLNDRYSMDQLTAYLKSDKPLIKNESSRFAFINNEPSHYLFIDGNCVDSHKASNALIEQLCDNNEIRLNDFPNNETNLELLLTLVNMGSLYLVEK